MARTRQRRRLPRAERIDLILDVAYDDFTRHGYDGISMTRLAARADVTKPIVYRYFGSKDGLSTACIRRMGTALMATVQAAVDPALSPDRQLWSGILAHLRFIEEHRSEWRVFVREAPLRGDLAAATLSEGRRVVSRLIAELLGRALQAADAPATDPLELEIQAHALLGAVDQVAEWWEAHPTQPRELMALRIMNFAWQGFGDLLNEQLWLPPTEVQETGRSTQSAARENRQLPPT